MWEWDLNECLYEEKHFCSSNLKYVLFQKPVRDGILKYFCFLYKTSLKQHLCVRDHQMAPFLANSFFFS